jgi:hypothetical protein
MCRRRFTSSGRFPCGRDFRQRGRTVSRADDTTHPSLQDQTLSATGRVYDVDSPGSFFTAGIRCIVRTSGSDHAADVGDWAAGKRLQPDRPGVCATPVGDPPRLARPIHRNGQVDRLAADRRRAWDVGP